MTKGDKSNKTFSVYDSNGDPLDVSAYLIKFTAADAFEDGSPDIEKANAAAGGGASQISMGPDTNQFVVYVLPADTSSITILPDKSKDLYFDLKFSTDAGVSYTHWVSQAIFKIKTGVSVS